jgi:ADP-heptose:LPS heptosyltransferase
MKIYSSIYRFQYVWRQKFINWIYKNSSHEINLSLIAKPENILIICTGLLGDSVMSSPVLPKLREIYPNSKIIFLGKKNNCELFYDCPYIDEFKITTVIPFTILHKSKENMLLKWIRSKKIDLAIVLVGAQFGKILKNANIPIRVCTDLKGANLPNLYTHLYESSTPKTWGPNEQLNALRCLGHQVPFTLPKIWVNEIISFNVKDILFSRGLQINEAFVVIHPFGSTKRQWWDLNNIKILATEIYTKFKMKTILIGGKETENLVPTNKYIIDLSGMLSIGELISIINLAKVIVTTDSGPFHIAGALNKFIVGLFRSSRPEFKELYPKSNIILGYNVECLNKCKWDKCINEKCNQLQEIKPSHVVLSINTLLKAC